jgi:hypothetical protein
MNEKREEFFVNIHNERHKNFWNKNDYTISCRVRFTKNNNSQNFRNNIIRFLYNENKPETQNLIDEIQKEDSQIFAKKLGFDKFENRELSNPEKHKQYLLAQFASSLDKFSIIKVLGLENVVSVRIKGYYKELFFLKCIFNDLYIPLTLRALYKLESPETFNLEIFLMERVLVEDLNELQKPEVYQHEIRLIVKEYLQWK